MQVRQHGPPEDRMLSARHGDLASDLLTKTDNEGFDMVVTSKSHTHRSNQRLLLVSQLWVCVVPHRGKGRTEPHLLDLGPRPGLTGETRRVEKDML
jgi:hypothetical protein